MDYRCYCVGNMRKCVKYDHYCTYYNKQVVSMGQYIMTFSYKLDNYVDPSLMLHWSNRNLKKLFLPVGSLCGTHVRNRYRVALTDNKSELLCTHVHPLCFVCTYYYKIPHGICSWKTLIVDYFLFLSSLFSFPNFFQVI